MPKQIMEFNLPEDKEALDNAYHGTEWMLVVWHMRDDLVKNIGNVSQATSAILQGALDNLNGWVEFYGLSLDKEAF